jgi:hypothetical protein
MSGSSRVKPPVERELWWQLRIELLEVAPTVWRRIIVPETITLPRLHRVLQACMGWTNSHLHEFVINGIRYSEPDPDWDEELRQVDERRVVLQKALGHESRCFDYIYDFGDNWHHIVVVEDPYASRSGRAAGIQCTAGENACPPEDVGGPHGYADFLGAIADPDHEEQSNYLSWSGGSFDPARFELPIVQRALAKIKN